MTHPLAVNEEIDNQGKIDVLCQMADALNKANVLWGLGGSLLLFLEGIAPSFHDIDVLVSEKDRKKVLIALAFLGNAETAKPQTAFHTKTFLEFNYKGVEIDIISGFVVVNNGLAHYLPLRRRQIKEIAILNGVKVPLMSVRVWRRYYGLMGRVEKVTLIDDALKKGKPF